MKIALMGKARSGKNTIATLIRKNFEGSHLFELAFGDELKRSFHETLDVSLTPKPREGYEIYGMACRNIDKDVWVKKVQARQRILEERFVTNFIITDLRQPNELDWCVAEGYTIVKVVASDEERIVRSWGTDSSFQTTNPSEEMIDELEYDFVIRNEGSIELLEMKVKQLLNILKES